MITFVMNNRTGKPESAERAIKHKEDGHCCISCGCVLRIYRTSAGNVCARLPSHGTHKVNCACVEHEKDKRVIDITRTDPKRIDEAERCGLGKSYNPFLDRRYIERSRKGE